ncbi:hypothetical protein GF359_08785 [candidate division WOR-3 bacterium]|uniref:TVP38/TMEM64 family membrane protein n=1 Tax=candidate division WOR-3 bacterium TaxID=2052148 RepID=A0A9D5QER9_UNCW3|nr:hypothetical protein [candidate division WOR-3 bacterium]MBD3365295.1 hypothetical protein [candidate division WOR-3 bacterium]
MLKRPQPIDYVVLAIFIIVIMAIIGLIIWQWPLLEHFISFPEQLRDYVDDFGIFAPIVFVGLYALLVILAVLPAYLLNIASGAMFGFWQGVALSWLGTMIGAFFVIVVMRRVALSVMRILIPNEKIERFGRFVQKYGWFYLFLLYLIPNPLGDLVNYVSAASRLKIHKLLIMVAIGRLPTLILFAGLGTRIQTFSWWQWVIVGACFLLLIALFILFRKQLNRFAENLSVRLFPHPPHRSAVDNR